MARPREDARGHETDRALRRRGVATKFQILASLCTSLRAENDGLRAATDEATRATAALRDLESEHVHLQRAHTAQAGFIQKLQADRAKIEAYKTTIAMQEKVIVKLEHVVSAKLKEIVTQRQAELELARTPVEKPVRVEVPVKDPAVERELHAAKDTIRQASIEKRGLQSLIEAKDARIKVLEEQFIEKAAESAQQAANLNLRIFELEMSRPDPGDSLPR